MTFGRGALAIGASAAAYALLQAGDGTAGGWIAGAVLLIAAGAIAGRWWVAALPIAAMTAVGVWFATHPPEGNPGDLGPEGTIMVMFSVGCGMAFCVLIGASITHLWRSRHEPAQGSRFSPQKDALKFPL